jgi:hypothetical protein
MVDAVHEVLELLFARFRRALFALYPHCALLQVCLERPAMVVSALCVKLREQRGNP